MDASGQQTTPRAGKSSLGCGGKIARHLTAGLLMKKTYAD